MLDWPISSPQMMTILGFCCCAAAGAQASAAANSDAATNDVVVDVSHPVGRELEIAGLEWREVDLVKVGRKDRRDPEALFTGDIRMDLAVEERCGQCGVIREQRETAGAPFLDVVGPEVAGDRSDALALQAVGPGVGEPARSEDTYL